MTINIRGYDLLVDEDDLQLINSFNWGQDDRGRQVYFKAHKTINSKGKRYYLHRLIANAEDGTVVDHINGNTLDNRKKNLRICTQGDNLCNCSPRAGTSKYKGIYWDKKRAKWYGEIKRDRKKIYVGLFDDEIIAAMHVDMAMAEHHGEYARLNFEDLSNDNT